MATAEKDNIPKNMKLNVLLLGRDFKAFYCHATRAAASTMPLFS